VITPDRLRPGRRPATLAAALALAAAALVACGGDDDEAQTLSFTASGDDRGAAISGPSSAEAGAAEITLTNDGTKEADLQLLRVEGEHSPADVITAAGGAINGKPLPDWFFAGGGVGLTPGGESQTVTQVLEPGTYYAVNTGADGPPDPKTVPAIEVGGDASDDELPDSDATVTSIDYGFETDGAFEAGVNEITFENTGAQPHHIVAERIAEGKTIDDVRGFLANNQGGSPFDQAALDETSVLDAGGSQVTTLNLKPGKYALLCFVSDRQGGPPHSIGRGMLGQIEVE
jgi:hypothetical protein